MALRALLFSKEAETNRILTTVCQNAGVRVEVCDDIFNAMEKGTKQPYAFIFVDWSSQPEAGFLLKRARESGPNKSFVAIAVVHRDPSAADMRDHNLSYLIHRPVAADEVRDSVASAMGKMGPAATAASADVPEPVQAPAPTAPKTSAKAEPDAEPQVDPKFAFEWSEDKPDEGEPVAETPPAPQRDYRAIAGYVIAIVLVLAAASAFWNGHDLIFGFIKSPEGKGRALRQSVVAFFHLEQPDVMPVIGAKPAAPDGTSFSGSTTPATPADGSTPGSQLQVVEDQPALDNSAVQLRKAEDFPMPAPQLDPSAPKPVEARHAQIPDSIRGSAPIAPPVVVTTTPAQMMPVSAPMIPPPSSQASSDPVSLSEDSARTLLIRSVNPEYPPEAASQKMRGPIILQATIGRDGSVEDLKIVRGYFVLGKAAIAAVKQWQFKPYTVNGKAERVQTTITVNFESPKG